MSKREIQEGMATRKQQQTNRFIVISYSQKVFDNWYIVQNVIHTFSYLWPQVDIMFRNRNTRKNNSAANVPTALKYSD